mmetsp:Transcript_24151/g.77905  ORF Transcript_24151/g.77905 Transcript_24151/m.77905 type:complete len:257 (+) Transcript_24151:2045-2815(+)
MGNFCLFISGGLHATVAVRARVHGHLPCAPSPRDAPRVGVHLEDASRLERSALAQRRARHLRLHVLGHGPHPPGPPLRERPHPVRRHAPPGHRPRHRPRPVAPPLRTSLSPRRLPRSPPAPRSRPNRPRPRRRRQPRHRPRRRPRQALRPALDPSPRPRRQATRLSPGPAPRPRRGRRPRSPPETHRTVGNALRPPLETPRPRQRQKTYRRRSRRTPAPRRPQAQPSLGRRPFCSFVLQADRGRPPSSASKPANVI